MEGYARLPEGHEAGVLNAAQSRRAGTRRCVRVRWWAALVVIFASLHHAAGNNCNSAGNACKGYVCNSNNTNGREGFHLKFGPRSKTGADHLLMHTGRNISLYGSTFTLQLFAKITNSEVGTKTLIGSMPGNVKQGWRVACNVQSGTCCLQAYLKQIPENKQQVCTHTNWGRIENNTWFHLTARYETRGNDPIESKKGIAAIFVNGIKHNEVEWGNNGRGNISYAHPYPPFAIGGTDGSRDTFFEGSMDEVRLWRTALSDAAILDTSFETAWQFREVDNTCKFASTPYGTEYTRIASVADLSPLILYIKDPQNMCSSPAKPPFAESCDTRSNQNIRGHPVFTTASKDIVGGETEAGYIEKEPLLELLPTSKGVIADVFPRMGASEYRSNVADDLTVVASQHHVTVLDMRVRDPNYDDVVSIRRMLDFSNPGMRDQCVREGIGVKEMSTCGNDDRVGWHSFAGVAGYEGLHSEGSEVKNLILDDSNQWLDVDNLLFMTGQSSNRDIRSRCRRANVAASALGVDGFLPPFSEVQSRVHLRLVWTHRTDLDWWVPVDGLEYDVLIRSYSRYKERGNCQASSECSAPQRENGQASSSCNGAQNSYAPGVCSKLKLGLHIQFSPEFVNNKTYPKVQQELPDSTAKIRYAHDATATNAVRDGDELAVTIGEELQFTVRVHDRNKGDVNDIRAREDPGLPPGYTIANVGGKGKEHTAGLLQYPKRSKLVFNQAFNRSRMFKEEDSQVPCNPGAADWKCQNCATNYNNLTFDGADLSPPYYTDRVFAYAPREEHAGGVFRVCLYAVTADYTRCRQTFPATNSCTSVGLWRYDMSSKTSSDLCVKIRVIVPAPKLLLPQGRRRFEAIVGCRLTIRLTLQDNSMDGFVVNGSLIRFDLPNGIPSVPYKYVVVSTVEGSEVCSSGAYREGSDDAEAALNAAPRGDSEPRKRSECMPVAPPWVAGAEGGLPRGMRIVDGLGPNTGEAEKECSSSTCTILWTPERGQELEYKLCVRGRVDSIFKEYTALHLSPIVPECFVVRVRKCQECVRKGQSLASLARSLRTDMLSLYLSNPFVQRPEKLEPGTVLSTGPIYEVRLGDHLSALSDRFLVSEYELRESNPDVDLSANATIMPGLQLCVRAPVCEADCKHGTECALHADGR